jgi:NUMOD3 motif
MNHQKIYESIIQKAKSENRKKLKKFDIDYVYYDNHHIIPACLNGSDDQDNRQLLTDKEHYVCHKLLTYIYKGNRKIACAFHRMTYSKSGDHIKSARDYAYAKELMRLIPVSKETKQKQSKSLKGHIVTEETRQKLKIANSGKKASEEANEKNRKGHIGKKHTLETIEKMKKSQKGKNKGKKHSEEQNKKQRDKMKGQPSPMKGKHQSQETKRKNSLSHKGKDTWMKGKHHTKESILKMKISHTGSTSPQKGKKLSKEVCKKISQGLTGLKQSEETIQKRVLKTKGLKRKRIICKYCNNDFSVSTHNRWHGEKCKFK